MSTKLDTEVHVSFEDQKKINTFARTNALLQDLKEELDQKKKEIQNLEDAESEVMMIEDVDDLIPYQIGEVFVECTHSDILAKLDKAKEDLQSDMKTMESRCVDYKQILSDLKIQLYAKFGNNINLEADDD